MDGPAVNQVIDDLKRLEHEGYHFEAADASLELLMRRAAGWEQDFFRVESMRVITDELRDGRLHHRGDGQGVGSAEASSVTCTRREGNGPVNAIDSAMRAALAARYPLLDQGAPHRLQGAHPRRRDGHGRDHPRARSTRPTAIARGPPSASAPTSSRRRGGRSRKASSTASALGLTESDGRAPAGRNDAHGRAEVRPVSPVDDSRVYGSPDVVPASWMPDRPGRPHRLPARGRCGSATRAPTRASRSRSPTAFADRLQLQPGEHVADAIQGCLGIALRRASMFSRAPVVHDLTIAFTIWGFLDTDAAGRVGVAAAAVCSRASATRCTTTTRPGRSSTWCPRRRCG